MKDNVWISSSALGARNVTDAASHCLAMGLARLELTAGFRFTDHLLDEMQAATRSGVKLLLHNYFPPPKVAFVINLASCNKEIRERSIAHCKQALELSSVLSAPFFSVHAGLSVDADPAALGRQLSADGLTPLSVSAAVFHESVADLCLYAENLGISLLIENNVLSQGNVVNGKNALLLCVTPDDVEELFDEVRSPALGLLLDVGHLKVSARTMGFDRDAAIRQMARHVRAVHVSDNDGDVDDNSPFERDAWFLSHLRDLVPRAPCVVETRKLPADALLTCVRLLEEVTEDSIA